MHYCALTPVGWTEKVEAELLDFDISQTHFNKFKQICYGCMWEER